MRSTVLLAAVAAAAAALALASAGGGAEAARVMGGAPCGSKSPNKWCIMTNRRGAPRSYPGGHTGNDFDSADEKIYSILPGVVKEVKKNSRGYGNQFTIEHSPSHHGIDGNTYKSRYAHLKSIPSFISVGACVCRGQYIGPMGATGGNYAVHLHLDFWRNAARVGYCETTSVSNNVCRNSDGSSVSPRDEPCSCQGCPGNVGAGGFRCSGSNGGGGDDPAPAQPQPAEPATPSLPCGTTYVRVIYNGINIRPEPSLRRAPIRTERLNKVIALVSASKQRGGNYEWYTIADSSGGGFVASSIVSAPEQTSACAGGNAPVMPVVMPVVTDPEPCGEVVTLTANLNVRETPCGRRVGGLVRGSEARIVEGSFASSVPRCNWNWISVIKPSGSLAGWVAKEYTRLQPGGRPCGAGQQALPFNGFRMSELAASPEAADGAVVLADDDGPGPLGPLDNDGNEQRDTPAAGTPMAVIIGIVAGVVALLFCVGFAVGVAVFRRSRQASGTAGAPSPAVMFGSGRASTYDSSAGSRRVSYRAGYRSAARSNRSRTGSRAVPVNHYGL